MAFHPEPGTILEIGGTTYHMAPHPAAPRLAYGQEGRAGIVFQLLAPDGQAHALKVFKPRFQVPAMVMLADRLARLADVPGLAVCRRSVLSARSQRELLRQYPELNYAALMPWIAGPTWLQAVAERRALTAEHSLALAQSLLEMLTTLEERGAAHCDISSTNVILTNEERAVALVDVEQMYAAGFARPEVLTTGSAGYARAAHAEAAWSSLGDRFAGAVLVGEILGWCEDEVRQAAGAESYFEFSDLQARTPVETPRYTVLRTALERRWGDGIAGLFEQAWLSEDLAGCPNFGAWLAALPDHPRVEALAAVPAHEELGPEPSEERWAALVDWAARFERAGDWLVGGRLYQEALAACPPGGMQQELTSMVAQRAAKLSAARDPLVQQLIEGLAADGQGDRAQATQQLDDVRRTLESRPGLKRRSHLSGWTWLGIGAALLVCAVGGWIGGWTWPRWVDGVSAPASSTISVAVVRPNTASTSNALRTAEPGTPTAVPTQVPLSPTLSREPPSATPTATPTATPIQEILQNFDNAAWDGHLDYGVWAPHIGSNSTVEQRDGVVHISHVPMPDRDTTQLAFRRTFSLDQLQSFEARLMLETSSGSGNVHLNIGADALSWWTQCLIHNYSPPKVSCIATSWPVSKFDYQTKFTVTDFGHWHTVRIDVDPVAVKFRYFLDGEPIGEYQPPDPERFARTTYTLDVSAWSSSTTVLAQVDDIQVRLQPLP